MQPTELSLTEAAGLIARRELSAVEYSRQLLDRIEDQAALNAFITVRPEALLAAAEEADAALARGVRPGPLHGVPIAVKDNLDTADLPTSGGTPTLRNHRPTADAEAVAALRRAGALVLGKTNLHELAYGITGVNATYGAVQNPYLRSRFAGGSSSGSAAAVAACLAPAALGTDTGGSVRVPASLCGVAGLRPTMGRYPQRGIMLVSSTRDTVGALTRNVVDLGLMDAVLAGSAEPDLAEVDPRREFRGLRLGVPREPFAPSRAPDVARVFAHRLAELSELGASIVDVELPDEVDSLLADAGFPIAFYETARQLTRYLVEAELPMTLPQLVDGCGSADVRSLLTGFLGEHAVPEDVYQTALTVHRPALDRALRSVFVRYRLDAVVWPTTPLTAAPLEAREVLLGGEPTSPFLAYTRTTNPGTIVGWPGSTVPSGLDEDGLPIGLALDGLPNSDTTLIRLARACEIVFGPLPPPADPIGADHADSLS